MSFRNVRREYRREYSREMIFGLVLLMLVGLSTWLGTYIPESLYLNGITQIMNGCIATMCLAGAWLMMRHSEGMKIRKIWVMVLLVYAVFATTLLMRLTSFVDQPRTGFMCLQGWQILVGNFLLWLLLLIIGYSTEQILFRQDPQFLEFEVEEETKENKESSAETNAEYRHILEEWMEKEKPYLNPAFRLLDLRQVLPLNRTYLSQLINSEYGCSFYQFVTHYRVEEAKRLLHEQPAMKMQDIAEHCGFSSPTVFARIFARETGKNPSEWCAKQDANETL